MVVRQVGGQVLGRRARVWLTVALALSMVVGQLPSVAVAQSAGPTDLAITAAVSAPPAAALRSPTGGTAIALGRVAPAQPNPPAGNGCGGCTLFQGQTDPASPSYAAPVAGTLTSWSVQGPSDGCATCVVRLRVFRQTAPGEFLTVAESSDQNVAAGVNTFPVNISVLAGDLLGIRATDGIRWYAGNTGDQIKFVAGNPAPGQSTTPIGSCATAACWFYDPNATASLTNVAATLQPAGDFALHFNGDPSYLTGSKAIANSAAIHSALSYDFTIDTWVKWDGSGAYVGIVSLPRGTDGEVGTGITLALDNGYPFLAMQDQATNLRTARTSVPLTPHRWTHVVASYDGWTTSITSDGANAGGADYGGCWPVPASTNPLLLGTEFQNLTGLADRHFGGAIDLLTIKQGVANPTHFCSEINGPTVSWSFDEGFGAVARATSGGPADANLYNGVTWVSGHTGDPTISGTVLDSLERPLANASVAVEVAGNGPLAGTTSTDASGKWSVPVTPGKSYWVAIAPPVGSHFAPQFYNDAISSIGATAVPVTDADVVGIDVFLRPGFALSGRAFGADQIPLAGVIVEVYQGDVCCAPVAGVQTNADGFYSIDLAANYDYRMRIRTTAGEQWWNGVPNPGTTTQSGWNVATPFRMETTTQTCRDTSSISLLDNWNLDAVLGGGTPPGFSTTEPTYCVTQIVTYHLATGIGATGGTISLRGGNTIGPLGVNVRPASLGYTNWVVSPRLGSAIIQGNYRCEDSDQPTWAQNAGSGGSGFCKVFGVPLDTTTTIGPRPGMNFTLGGGELSGIAQCGVGVLPSAKVELLSGKTVVATTTADESGSYRFPTIAPNAAFTLRYTSANGLITCVAGVTTGESGTTVAPPPSIPSLGNSTWPTAFRLGTEGTAQDDYLAVPRDAWFKVTIGPSQQIVVSLRNCAFDCSLVLYTDIAQAAAELQAQSIASGQRQIAPAELSPAELSPAELSPAELSPAELSPAELSPAELSPAELSPAELSPAELSPAELSALAYSSAQTRSILAVSAHAGLSPELIVRNTWEHTGDFYVRVLSHDGTTSTQPFTISTRVLPGACVGVNLTKAPSLLTASLATSIILTNTSRLVSSPATATAAAMTVAQFKTRLDQFATKNNAKVIDLAQDAGIQLNYANWDAHPGCALAANTVADSIHDLIQRYRALGALKYITIAGSDRVVPFRRVPDLAGLGNESTYHVPVLDSSQSAAALNSGYFLSQDYYAAPAPILRGNLRIDLPQEAIGRIVESLRDMTAMLNAYDAVGGVAKPKTAVSTGYDFIADLANQLKTTFQAEGLTVDTLIEAAGLKATDPTAWTADQLRTFLFGAKAYGIYAINGHFSGNRALAADYATLIDSAEVAALPALDTRYLNALVLSMGCHAAYNIVDPDAVPNATQPVGWVEAFNGRGATVVGSTGYGYADTDFVQYSELVLSKTATALGIGPSPVAIGDALRDAKSSYLSSLAAPEGIDAKAAAEATVYGLPMMRFDVARPSSATGQTPLTLTSGTSSELQYGTPVLSYVLNQHTTASVPVAGTTNRVNLTYYDASGDISVSPLQPVLPRNVTRIGGLPANTVLRGGALVSAQYTEVSPILPQTDAATTETRGQLPTAFASVFTPLRLFALNQVADRSLVVLPLQYLTDGVTGTARLYDAQHLNLRLYTSTRTDASALAAAPSISNVVLTPVTGGVHVDAVIGGLTAAGLEDVLFTYTNGPIAGVGTWQSRSLRDGEFHVDRRIESGLGFSEHVSGDILTGTPFDLRLFVQAVSGNAQVSVSSNIGAYFQLAPPTIATPTAPKHATTLTFTSAPAASVTYGGSISTTVRLSDGTTPLVGRPVAFEFGGHRVRVVTAGGGLATAHFEASFVPLARPYVLTAAFAEDQDLLGSELTADVVITRAASTFSGVTVSYAGSGATLGAILSANGRPLHEELVMITIRRGTKIAVTRPVLTDGTGRAQIDVSGLPNGGTDKYSATFDYAGSVFYVPSQASASPAPRVSGDGSLGTDKSNSFELNVRVKSQDNDAEKREEDQRGRDDQKGKKDEKPARLLSGSFNFHSKPGHLEFESNSFQSLAVAGGRAEILGTGKVAGSPTTWQFRLVVVDGSPDTFELSIWDRTGSLATPWFHIGPSIVNGDIRIR